MADDVGAALRATVERETVRLRAMSEEEAARRPSPEKWNRKEVLGHLIDSACNNHQRIVRALLSNELDFPAYAQDDWVRCQDHAGEEWGVLVGLWHAYNRRLASIIALVPRDKLATRCRIGDGRPTTLGDLIVGYLRHLEHHLGQL